MARFDPRKSLMPRLPRKVRGRQTKDRSPLHVAATARTPPVSFL